MDSLTENKAHLLAGQVAIITGAGKGIGAAIARSLSSLGATAVLCGRDRSALDSVADALAKTGAKSEVIPCDVTRLESVEAAAKQVERQADTAIRPNGDAPQY